MLRNSVWALVWVLVFVSAGLTATRKGGSIPTVEQAHKLGAAAWKEPVRSIDITFYREVFRVPASVEQLRQKAEDVADRFFKGRPLESLTPNEVEMRNRIIATNLKNWMELEKVPRILKSRVRISGDRQRADVVRQDPYRPIGPDTPFVDTYINAREANTGNPITYHYAGEMRTVFVDRGSWAEEAVTQFSYMPIAKGFQASLGKDQGGTPKSPNFVPDPEKIRELSRTGLASMEFPGMATTQRNSLIRNIAIRPDPNFPDTRDRIEVGEQVGPPEVILECDRTDYSRVYRTEFRMPETNKITYARYADGFDPNGFPHQVTEVKYDKDGNLQEKNVYRIMAVKLNPSIPLEVFELHPPQGYRIVDSRTNESGR
jgi:hypothetical protein